MRQNPPWAPQSRSWEPPGAGRPGPHNARTQYDAFEHNNGVTYARDARPPGYSYGGAVAVRQPRSPGATVNTMTVEEGQSHWHSPGPLYAPHEPDAFDNTAEDEPYSENGC